MSPRLNLPSALASHQSEMPLVSSLDIGVKWVGVTPLTLVSVTSTFRSWVWLTKRLSETASAGSGPAPLRTTM